MQGAGRSDIDLVLTGTDFLAAGIEQGVLMKILPDNAAKFRISWRTISLLQRRCRSSRRTTRRRLFMRPAR